MWHYEEEPVNGGAGGEVFRSIFNGSGTDAASRLAREAIQNSVDATRPGDRPRITLEMKRYSGVDLDQVWETLGLDELAPRESLLRLHEGNALREKPDVLRVLHAKDSGTTGLSGDPTSPSSKLRKLLMEIGGSQKVAEDKLSGGSYGFGKAVYSASSRIAVIFAYSRTEDQSGAPISLFMGCAYHTAHEFEGKRTSGRAFFGKATALENAIRFDPFLGDEADDLARMLQVDRAEGDFGTTIAIVDCPLSMEDVKRGVERSWWPKIYRDNFKVRILDEDGARLTPRPLLDPELRPFIEAINVALGRSPEKPGVSKIKKNFKPIGDGLTLGQLGLFVMKDEDLDEDEVESDLRDTIALVRSPGMVVHYYGKRTVNHPPVAGVFLADDDLDDILRRSEPPEHDRWDKNADRLEPAKNESEVVAGLHNRIWREMRAFQRSARPADPPPGNRLLQLERDLARLFGSTGKRSPIGEGRGETPISLKPKVFVTSEGGGLKVKGVVKLGLKKEHPEALSVLLNLRLNAVDEAGRRVDPVELTADFGGVEAVQVGEHAWRVVLSPAGTIEVAVESDLYDPEWTVEFNPTVQPSEEAVA